MPNFSNNNKRKAFFSKYWKKKSCDRTNGLSTKTFKRDLITNEACIEDLLKTSKEKYSLSEENKYKAFKLYFNDSQDSPNLLKLLKAIENHFYKENIIENWATISEKGSFLVDYQSLLHDDELCESWNTLVSDIIGKSEYVLSCFGLVMYQLIEEKIQQQINILYEKEQEIEGDEAVDPPEIPNIPLIIARIKNFEPITSLKQLKANLYGKFVTIKGTVVRVSNIKPICIQLAFTCLSCGSVQAVHQPEGKLTYPTKCETLFCHSKNFAPFRNSTSTVTVDWQNIRVQELIQNDSEEGGRIARTVDCELMYDLVDCCVPGNLVTVTGIVKVKNNDHILARKGQDSSLFLLYIKANCITDTKDCTGLGGDDFNIEDLYAIKKIQSHNDVFHLLVSSLCPTIFGHEIVKAGLLLGLFGAPTKYLTDRNLLPIRGSPHILLVGDPGLGKSQMLQACANIATRGVYVCGNTTTISGLTVTLARDSSSGDYMLEAGALVLADRGCCCIDEFDKMKNQHAALLEAMEQQTISIAKAGIVCCLPARTTVLAAANPIGGHYNTNKTVSENLKMNSVLLSRFDLVFVMLDKPDEELDTRLSEHIMAVLDGSKRTSFMSTNNSCTQHLRATVNYKNNSSLKERLKASNESRSNLVSQSMFRKYLTYAQKYVNPKLTSEAASMLQSFYLELRQKHKLCGNTVITMRQLYSLIRLSEARARIELRENVTVEDCIDVIEIIKYSLIDTYNDGKGKLDFSRSQNGSGMSNRKKAKQFISALKIESERLMKSIFTFQELKSIAKASRTIVIDFIAFIDSLNSQGFLLKKGPNLYQLQFVEF